MEVVDDSDGCGAKFSVVVVSPKFTGISLLQRQRLVNEVLKVEMETIHALSQRTLTPEQWATQQGGVAAASAPGKVILFGEHSVVYGKRAVAATLARRTTVTLCPLLECQLVTINMPAVGISKLVLHLPRNEPTISSPSLADSPLNIPAVTEGSTPQLLCRLGWWALLLKGQEFSKGVEQALSVLAFLHSTLTPPGHFPRGLGVEVASQLKPGAGTGSSAAYAVAMAAAMSQLVGAGLSNQQIEQLAWKAEHFVHGTPSGLDTAISCQGGMLSFSKDARDSVLPSWSLRVLLVDSCVERNTRHMVQLARGRLENVGTARDCFLDTMDQVARAAVTALQEEQSTSFTKLEHLVLMNQGLLVGLGVSHPSLDSICACASRHGLSAKLTGAGGGGNAFVLIPPDLDSGKLATLQEELESLGFVSSEETLFGPGVQVIQ